MLIIKLKMLKVLSELIISEKIPISMLLNITKLTLSKSFNKRNKCYLFPESIYFKIFKFFLLN